MCSEIIMKAKKSCDYEIERQAAMEEC